MKIYWTTNQITADTQIAPSERRAQIREIKWGLLSTWRGWIGPLIAGIGAALGHALFPPGIPSIVGAVIGGALGGAVCGQVMCRQIERELRSTTATKSSMAPDG